MGFLFLKEKNKADNVIDCFIVNAGRDRRFFFYVNNVDFVWIKSFGVLHPADNVSEFAMKNVNLPLFSQCVYNTNSNSVFYEFVQYLNEMKAPSFFPTSVPTPFSRYDACRSDMTCARNWARDPRGQNCTGTCVQYQQVGFRVARECWYCFTLV